jgi:hypothetical protein
MVDPHPGDSRVQRDAEILMLDWLAQELGVEVHPRRVEVGDGYLEIDGVSDDSRVLVEAWAHQGPPKAAQKAKVTNDAFKLLAARRLLDGGARLILLLADEAAARPFVAGTWRAAALQEAGIEVLVAELPDQVRELIRAAQARQYR